jgi:phosphohistidine phosphatase
VKTLYLLRHAKSSWNNSSLSDHDRPLAKRGHEATVVLAKHMKSAGVSPAIVLCSTARRAQETLEGVKGALDDDVAVWSDQGLYGADDDELLAVLRELPSTVPSAMVVGHNPGLQDLALALAGDGDRTALARLQGKFPTGALATLTVPDTWTSLARGGAVLQALVVPRQLDD